MSFALTQFAKASLTDVMRTNKYFVEFEPINFISKSKPEYGSYLITSATFPFFTFNTTEMPYGAFKESVVNGIDYDPVTFSIISDMNGKMMKFLIDLSNEIIDPKTGLFNFKDEYTLNISISITTRYDVKVADVDLIDAYLINIDPISLGYGQKDEMVLLNPSFKYKKANYKTYGLLEKFKFNT